jgi:hypothetical protein
VFYLDVAYVESVCCKCFIYFGRVLQQMLYVASVSSACSARWCRQSCPLGRSSPVVHVGSQASTTIGAEHKAISMGMAACVENEAYIHAWLPSLSSYSS